MKSTRIKIGLFITATLLLYIGILLVRAKSDALAASLFAIAIDMLLISHDTKYS